MEEEFALPLCLNLGNRKVGRVWTFSLPSLVTCPGSSDWCRTHCYARRIEMLRPVCRHAWVRNLVISLDPGRFAAHVLGSLPDDADLVRVHVGGDFHDPGYVGAWERVCLSRPGTRFWSYTRSWRVPPLRRALERLRGLPNVELFASCDPDMPDPPADWRTAHVACDPRASGTPCRHQQGEVASCLECGHCFRPNGGDVVFKVH